MYMPVTPCCPHCPHKTLVIWLELCPGINGYLSNIVEAFACSNLKCRLPTLCDSIYIDPILEQKN